MDQPTPIQRWNSGAIGRSHAVAFNGVVWLVANTKEPGTPSAQQIDSTLDYLEAALIQAGSGKDRLLSVQVLLKDIADRDAFNDKWCQWIGEDPRNWPQRAVYGAALAPGLAIEIIAVAVQSA
ncbi:MAG: Rid family hydrolase [Caldilineales bacterium]